VGSVLDAFVLSALCRLLRPQSGPVPTEWTLATMAMAITLALRRPILFTLPSIFDQTVGILNNLRNFFNYERSAVKALPPNSCVGFASRPRRRFHMCELLNKLIIMLNKPHFALLCAN